MTDQTTITDHRLLEVTSNRALRNAEATGQRTYIAYFDNNEVRRFAVASAGHARVYASEYGERILHSRPIRVVWDR